MNKAKELLKVAYATYRRGEPGIAGDIFALAMADESAGELFGEDVDELKNKATDALATNNYDDAIGYIESIKAVAKDEDEAALSPGDFVEEPPAPDLAPAQVASIVALTRLIKAGGHLDLAEKITRALGL